MTEEFFGVILNKIEFEWKIEYFDNLLWSKNYFTFPILEKIINEMQVDNFMKIKGLLSWLTTEKENKDDLKEENLELSVQKNENYDFNFIKKQNFDENESKEFFFVRNYIKKCDLITNIKSKEIVKLKDEHNDLTSVFDLNDLINNYIFCNSKLLYCLVCNKSFSSPFELKENFECKSDYFHPRFFNNLNISFSLSNSSILNFPKNQKNICLHDGCKKKQINNEFMCCHKSNTSKGCTFGEGQHQLVIIENLI